MAQEKQYLPSTFGKVVTFQDGGELFNIDFVNAEELVGFINQNKDAKGAFRIQISKQKNDQSKLTVTLNTYVPKVKAEDDGSTDLPF